MYFELGEILVWCLIILFATATFLPLTKFPHGAIQGLGFLRLQVSVGIVLTAVAAAAILHGTGLLIALVILLLSGLANAIYIAKFTPLWPTQAKRPEPDFSDLKSNTVAILASNVKLSNRDYARFISMAQKEDPDILIGIELDQQWVDGIATLKPGYLEHVEVPLDTGYGMIVYSKLPLQNISIADRVTDGVPSICTKVQLQSGEWFRLYVVHPEPPVLTDYTSGRDSEVVLAGMEARDDVLPAIVTGDLNDVAWSSTTRRFQRLSGLLDPRVGRGFYNTFDARFPILRWPLDHLFHDPRFRLIEVRRLPDIGSDHFPMLFTVALAPETGKSNTPEEASSAEKSKAKEMVAEEKKNDREAIGSDWEDG